MASTHRPARDPLIDRLLSAPAEADFHRAVHLLQASVVDSVQVGKLGPAEREVVRFRPLLSLAFPAATVADITEKDKRFQIEGTFIGLYGISSPLPAYFTENLLHADDPTIERAFMTSFIIDCIRCFTVAGNECTSNLVIAAMAATRLHVA